MNLWPSRIDSYTMIVAIDFGASNTDAIARDGQTQRRWTIPSQGLPDAERIHTILAAGHIAMEQVEWIAVTGGDRSALPQAIEGRPLVPIGEVEAVGRGGLALGSLPEALVVSAGSGTAVIAATQEGYRHVTGTGVGGGTFQGLGRLLLGTADPIEIDALAQAGRHTGVNLTIGEIIGGAIGTLPPDTTAVNFGRMARENGTPSAADLAAGLANLVGQVIAVIAINAARSQKLEKIVVVGHLTDLRSIQITLTQVGDFYGVPITLPTQAGFATAIGALLGAEQHIRERSGE